MKTPLNADGDTIIEVLIATSIIGMIVVTGFAGANSNQSVELQTQERGGALQLAQTQIEEVRTLIDNGSITLGRAPANGDFCIDNSTSPPSVIATSSGPGNTCNFSASNMLSSVTPNYHVYLSDVSGNWTQIQASAQWYKAGGSGRESLSLQYRFYPSSMASSIPLAQGDAPSCTLSLSSNAFYTAGTHSATATLQFSNYPDTPWNISLSSSSSSSRLLSSLSGTGPFPGVPDGQTSTFTLTTASSNSPATYTATVEDYRGQSMCSATIAVTPTISDNFDRPDTGTLGSTSVGQVPWVNLGGSSWSTTTNGGGQAITSTPDYNNPAAIVQLGDPNATASIGISSNGGNDALILRALGSSDYLRLRSQIIASPYSYLVQTGSQQNSGPVCPPGQGCSSSTTSNTTFSYGWVGSGYYHSSTPQNYGGGACNSNNVGATESSSSPAYDSNGHPRGYNVDVSTCEITGSSTTYTTTYYWTTYTYTTESGVNYSDYLLLEEVVNGSSVSVLDNALVGYSPYGPSTLKGVVSGNNITAYTNLSGSPAFSYSTSIDSTGSGFGIGRGAGSSPGYTSSDLNNFIVQGQ
jgi:hypothetical protein